MKVVLDTNVLVSGLLTPSGPCGQITDLVIEREIILCVDERILEEYETVLSRFMSERTQAHIDDLLELIRYSSERVIPRPLAISLPDLSDLPFLEVAVFVEGILVTGNKKHFIPAIPRFKDRVNVVDPREFLYRLS